MSLIFRRALHSTPARSLARMQLIGRLAAPPEQHTSGSGVATIRYAVGTSHGTAENRTTSWFRVTSFDKDEKRTGLLLGLPKGTLMHVEADGRLSSYEDQEGRRRTGFDLIQRSYEILSRPQNAEPAEDDVGEMESSA